MSNKVFSNYLLPFFLIAFFQKDCSKQLTPVEEQLPQEKVRTIRVGAENFDLYLPMLEGKKVALAANQTSKVGERHLLDTLLAKGVEVKKVFAAEHGFRGTEDAGAAIVSGKDAKTGLPIISIYGTQKKPSRDELAGVDLLIFDMQDVGARFYTYISTMHYLMEACGENGVSFMVLDRPNPNGQQVDGPVLKREFQSFVGMHPIPVLHGMTVGELAKMINGEGWLKGGISCELTVIPCRNYSRDMLYELPVAPSPNLRSTKAIALYPSLCFFEGTIVSVGRGTPHPFECIGHPAFRQGDFTFTPAPSFGATAPKLSGQRCLGYDLSQLPLDSIRSQGVNLSWLIEFYQLLSPRNEFFLPSLFFDKLAGTDQLRKQITEGWSEEEIRESWREGLKEFKEKRQAYLIYP
jgi:uncharacterized protein YbbC (DUF1343 family)